MFPALIDTQMREGSTIFIKDNKPLLMIDVTYSGIDYYFTTTAIEDILGFTLASGILKDAEIIDKQKDFIIYFLEA